MKTSKLFGFALTLVFAINSTAQNSLNFDGTNDFVQTNYSGVLASNDRTFEAWVKVNNTAPSSNLTILDYGRNAAGDRNTFVVDNNRGLRFISGGTNANINSAVATVPVGIWTHVAFVLDNGTGFLYVNGSQVASGNLSNVNTGSGNANVTIGQRVSGGNIPFSGNIDEVRIWSVARTASEIMANMNSELCGTEPNLKAYYKLNQGIANGTNTGLTTVNGEVGNSGTATNFSMTGPVSNWDSGIVITSITPLDLTVILDTANLTFTSNDTNTTTTYQWFDCTTNSNVTGETAQSYSPRNGGTFSVILSNSNCTDTTACFTLSGTPNTPMPGEALHFDGTDDFIQTPYSGVLDSNNRTFEAWVNVSTSALPTNLTILDYGLNAAGGRNTFLIDGNRGVRFVSGGTNANLSSPAGLVVAGQWSHVAFVLNNGTGFIYVNGAQVATGNLSGVNTPTGNANVTLGQRVSGGSIPFSGLLDEVRIWSVARTAAEINSAMLVEFCGATPGLETNFNMNQGVAGANNTSITKLANIINNRDGTYNNFALTGSTSNFDTSSVNFMTPNIDTTVTQVGLLLTANDSTVDAYQWINCGNNMILAGDTMQSFTAQMNGNYAVILTKSGCSDTSACISVIGVGLEENNFKSAFYLSNNPIRNTFKLLNNSNLNASARIFNIQGVEVKVSQSVNSNAINFDVSTLSSGIYILSVTSEKGEVANFKLLKE